MKKIVVGLLSGVMLLSAFGVTSQTVQADQAATETTNENYIAFMIKGQVPVYSPKGMDLKMLTPESNKSYEVSTKDIIKLDDGTYLYPINDFQQYVKSTDVIQAMNDAPSNDWQVKPLDEVIHTKNLIGIPLYDESGNIIERRALSADSCWYTNGSMTNPKTGEVYYRVSTHEYVSSEDIV